ncbi:hypothetical protein NC652_037519 [Populus alba x Populus x berolinensis]|nr:hypothetical protein NC652_037507 [Populus alba x Populus x berolinensis]KAJ6866004.1 hypothetical protein NC652_037511 [Populus alba x Populus x berolinensis]KAJ6866017.1 hypothetical protein NC652_037519 [Populus alba x Populus x berolinensis]
MFFSFLSWLMATGCLYWTWPSYLILEAQRLPKPPTLLMCFFSA